MAEHPLYHHFAELISSFRTDPSCRVCYGAKGYVGFATQADGKITLQTCCGKPGETEYVRLQKQIDQRAEALANFLDTSIRESEERLSKKTLIGGVQYLWRRVLEKKEEKRWPIGITSDGRIAFADGDGKITTPSPPPPPKQKDAGWFFDGADRILP